jgi:hypothetical protein
MLTAPSIPTSFASYIPDAWPAWVCAAQLLPPQQFIACLSPSFEPLQHDMAVPPLAQQPAAALPSLWSQQLDPSPLLQDMG